MRSCDGIAFLAKGNTQPRSIDGKPGKKSPFEILYGFLPSFPFLLYILQVFFKVLTRNNKAEKKGQLSFYLNGGSNLLRGFVQATAAEPAGYIIYLRHLVAPAGDMSGTCQGRGFITAASTTAAVAAEATAATFNTAAAASREATAATVTDGNITVSGTVASEAASCSIPSVGQQ